MRAAVLLPLFIGLSAQAIVALIALTPPVVAVQAAATFGLRPSDIGLFTTLLFLTAMITAAAGGGLVARFGPIRVSQVCLLSCGFGIALTATAELPVAALGALLVGIGYGPMTPASSYLLAPVSTEKTRPLIFSVKQTSIPVGGVLAGLLVPVLAGAGDWRVAVLSVGAVGILSAVALQPLRGRYDAARDRTAPTRLAVAGPIRAVLRHPRLRQLAVVSLLFSSMQICFSAFFVAFLSERLGMGLAAAGFALAVAQATGVLGRILWGFVAGRWVPARLLLGLIGLAMAASAVATLAVTPGWPYALIIALAVVFGATAIGWNGLFLSEIVRVTSTAESARATGGALFFTFGGMMVAPAIFSFIVGLSGSYSAAYGLAALMLAPGALLLFRREKAA